METTIFKIGDPVFDIRYGWGKVEAGHNLLSVQFEDEYIVYDESDIHFLSFTEYDLVSGGWSQDRSVLNQPKKGDLVYVRDTENELWEIRYFSHKKNGIAYCFNNQEKIGSAKDWAFMEVENPLLKQ